MAALQSATLASDLMASLAALEQMTQGMDAFKLATQLGARNDELRGLTRELQQQEAAAARQAEECRSLQRTLDAARQEALAQRVEQGAKQAALEEQVAALEGERAALKQELASRDARERETRERHGQELARAESRMAALASLVAALRTESAEAQRTAAAARQDCEVAQRDCKSAQLDTAIHQKKREDVIADKLAVEEERDRHRYWLDVLCSPHLAVPFAREHQPAVHSALAALEEQLEAAAKAVEIARETAREQLLIQRARSRKLLDSQQVTILGLRTRLSEVEARAQEAGEATAPATVELDGPCTVCVGVAASGEVASRCGSEDGASSAACSVPPSEAPESLSRENSASSIGSVWVEGAGDELGAASGPELSSPPSC